MDLLERRRTMMQEAADQVEGGGPNDGKYLAISDPSTQTSRWVSSDFGVSWTQITNAAAYPTGSFYVDCSGSLFYAGGHATYRYASVNYPITQRNGTVAANYLKIDRSTQNYYAAAASDRHSQLVAIATDSDIKIIQKTSQPTYGLSASLVRTIPIPAALNTKTTLPNGRCLSADQSFTRIYLSMDENCHWGKGWADGYITLDGGTTWTNVLDAVSNNSQSKEGKVRGAQWSEDGKYCAISIRETQGGAYVNTYLYLSKDYGSSFEQVATPAGYEIGGVVASEKFGYMYLNAINASNHYAAIFRSTNKGKTWTLISQSSAYREPPMMLCNAKGDKLVNGAMSGSVSTNAQLLYYSHDYGDTWQANTTGVKVRPQAGNVTRYAMSRDYVDNTGESPEPGVTYSMSLAQVRSTLETAINLQRVVRYSIDGSTLSNSVRLQFTAGDPWEYQDCTYYESTINEAPLIQGSVVGAECISAISYVDLTSFSQTWEEQYPDFSNEALAEFIAMSMNSARGSNPMYIEILS